MWHLNRLSSAVIGLILLTFLSAGCAPAPPTLSAVEPAGGPAGGGTELTLKGEGFKVGVEVTIGGLVAEITGLSPDGTSLDLIAPGGPTGDQEIRARHGADGKPSEPLVFTYQPVRILETVPAGGSTLSWADRPEGVELRFDQPLDIAKATFAVRPVPVQAAEEDDNEPLEGVANYEKSTSKLTFTATKKLSSGEHVVTVAGLQDQAGNKVDEVRFTFTVGPKPVQVASRSPGRQSGRSSGSRSSGRSSGTTYDDGALQTSYFGRDLRFVDTKQADYFWAEDGFSFKGRKFRFRPWQQPDFIGEKVAKRDAEDWRLARQMTPEIPQAFVEILSHTWRGHAEVSTKRGDVIVTGRIVDCSTGNATAKILVGFGAGAGYTTFDMKFTDARTGRLVAALHHRVVSGTVWSTTDSKLVKWMEKFGKQIVKRDFGGLYRRGDLVDD